MQTFPDLLTVTQMRLAYSTTVAAVSKTDDALAWWCIEELLERIESLPVSEAASAHRQDALSATWKVASAPSSSTAPDQAAVPALSSSADESKVVTPLDTRVSTLPRGSYLLALSALLPSVSLVLLPPLLSHLERLVRLEPVESDGRAALVEAIFEQVGMGMDAVKRKEATEWWLLHASELRNGGPLRDDADEDRATGAGTASGFGFARETQAAEKAAATTVGEGTSGSAVAKL